MTNIIPNNTNPALVGILINVQDTPEWSFEEWAKPHLHKTLPNRIQFSLPAQQNEEGKILYQWAFLTLPNWEKGHNLVDDLYFGHPSDEHVEGHRVWRLPTPNAGENFDYQTFNTELALGYTIATHITNRELENTANPIFLATLKYL